MRSVAEGILVLFRISLVMSEIGFVIMIDVMYISKDSNCRA